MSDDALKKSADYANEKLGQDLQLETASDEPSTLIHKEKTIEERKLVRKLDVRILPITCLLYLFACKSYFACHFKIDRLREDLDRTNLGNARLQGLPEDTLHGDPTGHLFDWVNSIFFFSYVSFSLDCIRCSLRSK
jgi:hypothetical protein